MSATQDPQGSQTSTPRARRGGERRHRLNVEQAAATQVTTNAKRRAAGQPVEDYVPLWRR